MRRFRGFTLSELMIAMAVLGIILAVVTPAVVKTRPNKNKMMVKKTYYTTEQIVGNLINDENLYPDKTEDCRDGDDTTTCYWGFDDTSKVSYEGNDYDGDTKFINLFKEKVNIKSEIGEDGLAFYTTDGVKWDLSDAKGKWISGKTSVGKFSDASPAAGKASITIDVNGDEAPNCRQADTGCSADNFDQYKIEILANGKMRIDPSDAKAIDYITINTSIKD